MDEMLRGTPLLPRAVEPLDDFILQIRFSGDETKYFGMKKMMVVGLFCPAENKQFFNSADCVRQRSMGRYH